MRVLIGSILALSVSFACDQPYEEVGGYKIGCPLDPASMPYDQGSDDERIRILSNDLPPDSFFDKVTTTLLDGSIEQLSFSKSYQSPQEMNNDRYLLLESMGKKWGEYIEISPKESISLHVSDKSNNLDIGYSKVVEITNLNPSRSSMVYFFDKIDNPVVDTVAISETLDPDFQMLNTTYFSRKMNEYKQDLLKKDNNKKNEQLKGF